MSSFDHSPNVSAGLSPQASLKAWKNVRLAEVLFLALMVMLVVLTKALLHRHLHVPGHSAFFLLFFLMLTKGGVRRPGSATIVGLIAGSDWVLMGFAGEGPMAVLTFVVPALVVDAFCAWNPSVPRRIVPAAFVGAVAGLSRIVGIIPAEIMAAAEPGIALKHIAIKSAAAVAFGLLGAALAPTLVRGLDRSAILRD